MRSGTLAESVRIGSPAGDQRQRNKPKQYKIERHGNSSFPAEHREGGKQAFLCPEDVYDASAAVLAETAEPAHFEVLLESVAKRLRRTPPDYLLPTVPSLLDEHRFAACRKSPNPLPSDSNQNIRP